MAANRSRLSMFEEMQYSANVGWQTGGQGTIYVPEPSPTQPFPIPWHSLHIGIGFLASLVRGGAVLALLQLDTALTVNDSLSHLEIQATSNVLCRASSFGSALSHLMQRELRLISAGCSLLEP